jgi:hypothetical protein
MNADEPLQIVVHFPAWGCTAVKAPTVPEEVLAVLLLYNRI